MKVAVYVPTYNDKHVNILKALAMGIPGAIVKNAIDFKPGVADIGVVFGWYKTAFEPTMVKKPIIEHYLAMGDRRLLVVESAFVKRGQYFQVGWNGFAGNADFNNHDMTADRWDAMGIKTRKWRDRHAPGYCIVIGQLPRDTQVQDVNHIAWCQWAVAEAQRVYGKDQVLFRPHPKCDKPEIYGIDKFIHDRRKIHVALRDAASVITWNSTTGIDALVAGVPVVAMDPGSIAWDMASHGIDEPLRYSPRREWFAKVGYTQWTLQEMREGQPWLHLTR